MQTKISKYLIQCQILTVCLMSLFFLSTSASAEETYVFERMWPTLQQPWYFNDPCEVAIDNSGCVYVADITNHRIYKFTSDGTFITKWGSEASWDVINAVCPQRSRLRGRRGCWLPDSIHRRYCESICNQDCHVASLLALLNALKWSSVGLRCQCSDLRLYFKLYAPYLTGPAMTRLQLDINTYETLKR